MSQFMFNLFALLVVFGAIGVVVSKNVVHGAMSLLVSLLGVTGLFVLLDAYLLAFVLLLVYAGAVVALFLFIVMLLDTHGDQRPGVKHLPLIASVITGALVVVGAASFIMHARLPEPILANVPVVGDSLKHYAYQLFTTYLLPVQVIGFLLLIAMIGVIVLSRKHEEAAS
ncbi:MAG: NADH-quinone oxidoreductase subunit J [Verrucomicrobia bacterium]|nr:NADH-quinone oxidoreductase subunit J [Verrucomicrobiota bacterium]